MAAKSKLVNIIGYLAIMIFVRWVYVKFINKTKFTQLVGLLKKKGWRMFGSPTCSWCQKQLEVFGEYANDINFVDCSKNPELCAKYKISGFPTWVDSQGNVYPGFKSPAILMMMVGK